MNQPSEPVRSASAGAGRALFLAPAIGLLVVLAIGLSLQALFGLYLRAPDSQPLLDALRLESDRISAIVRDQPGAVLAEFPARTFWGVTMVVFACMLVIGSGAGLIAFRHSGAPTRASVTVSLVLATAWFAVFGLGNAGGRGILRAILRLIPDPLPWRDLIAPFLQALSFVPVLLITGALCSLIRSPRAGLSPAELSARRRRLNVLLYISAAMLVSGVVEAFALFHWAAVLCDTGEGLSVSRRIVEEHARAMALMTGGFHTAVLLAVFLPAFTIADQQARAAAITHCDSPTPRAVGEWLAAWELESSWRDVAAKAAAVLAPLAGAFLASPLGDFIQSAAP